jgi:S-phase kinase-associated protein 1
MSDVKLISNDGKEFIVGMDIIKASNYLKKALERDPDHATIEIMECPSNILELVIQYIRLTTKKEPEPIPEVLNGNGLKEDLNDDLYFNYIERVEFETAFQLINAALLFEYVHLHDLACAKIASFMRGKTIEDINKEFTIECQLTAEDAKSIGLEVDEQQS